MKELKLRNGLIFCQRVAPISKTTLIFSYHGSKMLLLQVWLTTLYLIYSVYSIYCDIYMYIFIYIYIILSWKAVYYSHCNVGYNFIKSSCDKKSKVLFVMIKENCYKGKSVIMSPTCNVKLSKNTGNDLSILKLINWAKYKL